MKAVVKKQHVGIDIAKDDFKACLMQRMSNDRVRVKASRSFKNTSKGFCNFVAWLSKKACKDSPVHISMEATGVYHENLAYYLHEKGHRVSILLAVVVKSYLRSLNINTKTDKTDAKCIAQMGIERNLEPWHPISSEMRRLKQLTRAKGNLIKQKTALNNQLHALEHSHLPSKEVIQIIKKQQKLLEKQIEQLKQLIEDTIMRDDFLKERILKICRIRGLALDSVATIIAETNGFQHFSSIAQLISYAGYDVVENQSGSSIRGKTRISKKGNSNIRKALHFPALIAKRYEPVFQLVYERIFERTKIKMKAYVAIQRKLLILIYTLFKNNVAFDPNYYKKLSNEDTKSRQDTMLAYTG
ncbi:MAG: IS110 family transposase [Saprospiraceae bacterium]|nr:IS110 family transposase [Saprospiraceae bacterium]